MVLCVYKIDAKHIESEISNNYRLFLNKYWYCSVHINRFIVLFVLVNLFQPEWWREFNLSINFQSMHDFKMAWFKNGMHLLPRCPHRWYGPVYTGNGWEKFLWNCAKKKNLNLNVSLSLSLSLSLSSPTISCKHWKWLLGGREVKVYISQNKLISHLNASYKHYFPRRFSESARSIAFSALLVWLLSFIVKLTRQFAIECHTPILWMVLFKYSVNLMRKTSSMSWR